MEKQNKKTIGATLLAAFKVAIVIVIVSTFYPVGTAEAAPSEKISSLAQSEWFNGWKLGGQIIFGAESNSDKQGMWFDRAQLDAKNDKLSFWGYQGGLRFTVETFMDKDTSKPEIFLKYAYPWINLTDNLTIQAGYVPTPLVGPEDMGVRWLGRDVGKAMIDTYLGVSSRVLAGGVKYKFPFGGETYFVAGESPWGDGNAVSGIVEVKPFKDGLAKDFFVRAGGVYSMSTDPKSGDATLGLVRAGFHRDDLYDISVMMLASNGPAVHVAKKFPGLKSLPSDKKISNTGVEIMGRVYPFKVMDFSGDELKKVWLMARHRQIGGDFKFTQSTVDVGYDINKNLTIGAGPTYTTASENTGMKKSDMGAMISIQVKF